MRAYTMRLGVVFCIVASMLTAFVVGCGDDDDDDDVRQPTGSDVHAFWNQFSWNQLSPAEQQLWGILGWEEANWDGDETQSVPVPASDSKSWDELTEDERSAAEDLGHSEADWNPGEA